MDRLRQIHEMLDSCLTTEILASIDPPFNLWLDLFRTRRSKISRHRKIQIALLEKAGKALEKNFGDSLKGEELIHVGRRVDDFLTGRGYQVKPFL